VKILFDATHFGDTFNGITKSTLYLYDVCVKQNPSIQFIGVTKNDLVFSLPEGISTTKLSNGFLNRDYTGKNINRIIERTKAAVIHFPHNGYIPNGIKNIKKIMTLHDVLQFEIPPHLAHNYRNIYSFYKLYYFLIKNKDIHNADVIFTDSEYSKKQIIKYFKVKNEPVVLPFGPTICPPAIDFSLNILESPFFIYVGGYEIRKGIKKILESFLYLNKNKKINYKLFIIGKYKFIDTETETLLDKCVELDIVKQIGYISDIELVYYYMHAIGLIFLSKYEGFGLPPLEAMSLGCPVITTRYTSLPEICGNAALYVEPDEIAEVSNAIDSLFARTELRNKLVEEGKKQAQKFSWEKSSSIFLSNIIG
jgi:glycosyltransferase involved in cell wall biosynthesis